jgi:hypothetical protein
MERDNKGDQDVRGGNIKVNLVQIGWASGDWIGDSREGKLESWCERGNELSGSIKCWEATEWLHN